MYQNQDHVIRCHEELRDLQTHRYILTKTNDHHPGRYLKFDLHEVADSSLEFLVESCTTVF